MENVYVRAAVGGLIGASVGLVVWCIAYKAAQKIDDRKMKEMKELQKKSEMSLLKAEEALGKVLGGPSGLIKTPV